MKGQRRQMSDEELAKAFAEALDELCARFEVSLYHEDGHGAAYLVRETQPGCAANALGTPYVRDTPY